MFLRSSHKHEPFLFIYSKNADNKMIFDTYVTTITTGPLTFDIKNPFVYLDVEFCRV